MKHIVMVIGNYKNGGVAMRSTNLANEFAEKGYKVTILVTKEISDNVFFDMHENVSLVLLKDYIKEHSEDVTVVKYLKKRQKKLKTLKRLRYVSRFFPKYDKILMAYIREMRQSSDLFIFLVNNVRCLYIPFGLYYLDQMFYASKGLKCKILYAERNASEVEFPKDDYEKKRLLKIVSQVDGVVLQTYDELAFYGGKLKNANVIHNPVKVNLPEAYKGERRKTIVNFCRISEQKNLPLLFEAAVKFHKEYPEFVFEIYGNTVEESEEQLCVKYKEMIQSLKAEDYIKLLPPRKDIHKVVRDCAMFVSSSDYEGLSNSMIEAMAIGLPCVCTDCLGGGAREMIKNEENGLLVPMNDAEALFLAMKKFIQNPDLQKKCSENATKVREELSSEKIAEKWLEVIKNF